MEITNWSGRNGNNIIQVLRAIACCDNNEILKFPKHQLLKNNEIKITNHQKIRNAKTKKCQFFYINDMGWEEEKYLKIEEMENLFKKHISSNFKIGCDEINLFNEDDLLIHIRSGDTFSPFPHPAYLPPPLKFYLEIIEKYNNIFIIYEDNKNPVVGELLSKVKNIKDLSTRDLEKDLHYLCNAKNLVFGVGTFGLMIYFANKQIKNIYFPDYFAKICVEFLSYGEKEEYPKKIKIVNLPNYLKPGEWKNTKEQRKFLIDY